MREIMFVSGVTPVTPVTHIKKGNTGNTSNTILQHYFAHPRKHKIRIKNETAYRNGSQG